MRTRTWIALAALLSLLAPLAAFAASQPATTPLLLGTPAATATVVNPFLGADDATPAAATTPQVTGFLNFLATSPTTGRQLGKVCSISCRECVSSCPPGEGVCFRGGC